MKYDFDIIHDRKNTNSMKHDGWRRFNRPENALPLWVADMDFRVPQEVEDALAKCARHGIFGYSDTFSDGYWDALEKWYSDGFGYSPRREWLVKAPGIVFAIAVAVRAYTEEGDAVLIQRPVYHPFSEVVNINNRKLVNNPLKYENGGYVIDFEDFEKKIADNGVKLFIFCSPHNPVGRVWTREELEKIGGICLKYNCLVLSDEIHGDFVFAPRKHHVFSMVNPVFAENSIICTAPSKTFNLPGLQISNIFIPSASLRLRFTKEYARSGYSQLNTMGLTACEAAYRYGRQWLTQLLEYLAGNMKLVYEFGERTGVKPVPLEGTYLAWLDFSPLGLTQSELDDLVINKAGLWLSAGTTFGKEEGSNFQRMNIACPRQILVRALEQLETAVVRLIK